MRIALPHCNLRNLSNLRNLHNLRNLGNLRNLRNLRNLILRKKSTQIQIEYAK